MLDSGATTHFVKDSKGLTNFTEDKTSIKLADDSEAISNGYNDLYWKTADKISGKEITIKLKKVYLVPNLYQNILSLSAISDSSLTHQKLIAIRKICF